jgi:hypothetical protein
MNKDDYRIKSRYLQTFIRDIKFKNRNPKDDRVLDLLKEINTNPERVLLPEEKLFRCRIVRQYSSLGVEKNFWGYNFKDSFVPPSKKTADMRANYKYIPYLYCSNNPYTALVEVRPRIGSRVSIATILVNEKLTLLDFTMNKLPSKITDTKINLFSYLSYLFSKPIAYEDDTIDYIPTQYIAEYAKNLGYDGIAFNSSLTPEIESIDADSYPDIVNKYNVVVFNYKKCVPIRSNLFEVFGQYTECKQIDNDNKKLSVNMPINEMIETALMLN